MRDSSEVDDVTKKWDGRRHKFGQIELLGHDQFRTWLWGRGQRLTGCPPGGEAFSLYEPGHPAQMVRAKGGAVGIQLR